MFKNLDKKMLIFSILITTMPFLILFKDFDFSLFSNNSELFWSKLALYTANILGFIGASLLVWEFILGIRSLVKLFTADLIWVNKIHGIIGKYGILLVFIHPLLEMYVYAEQWLWLFVPNISTVVEKQYTFGRLAFILLLIIYLTSALVRGNIKYRPWLYIHYLAYPAMFFTFLHALTIGTFINQYVFLKALWFTMMALYFILMVFRLTSFSSVFKTKYRLIKKYLQTDDLLIIVLKPLKKLQNPKPGQYYYLQLGNFKESHPFSLLEFNQVSGELTFGIKVLGKFTKALNNLEINQDLFVDGPYGVFTKEGQNTQPKVIIAGGIGMTPFLELVKNHTTEQTFFLNSNRFFNEIIARPVLESLVGVNYYDFLSKEQNTNRPKVVNSRLKPEYLPQILGQNNLNQYRYFICGSPRFTLGVEEMLISLNIPITQIFSEKFSF